MTTDYTKKINISLTEEDFNFIKTEAAKDRRSIAQYASLLLEQTINKTDIQSVTESFDD